MSTYRVRWEMEFEAESGQDAARKALAVQRDPDSIATQFEVKRLGGESEWEYVDPGEEG